MDLPQLLRRLALTALLWQALVLACFGQRVMLTNALGLQPPAETVSRLEAAAAAIAQLYEPYGLQVPVYEYSAYSLQSVMSRVTAAEFAEDLRAAVTASAPGNEYFIGYGAIAYIDGSVRTKVFVEFNLPDLGGCFGALERGLLKRQLERLTEASVTSSQPHNAMADASEAITRYVSEKISCCQSGYKGCVTAVGDQSKSSLTEELWRKGWLPLMEFESISVPAPQARSKASAKPQARTRTKGSAKLVGLDAAGLVVAVEDGSGNFDFTADIATRLVAAGCSGRIRYFDLGDAGAPYLDYLDAALEAGPGAVFAEWIVIRYDSTSPASIFMRASYDRTHPQALAGLEGGKLGENQAKATGYTPQQLLLEFFINLAVEVVADGTISYIVEYLGTPDQQYPRRFSYAWEQVCQKYSLGQFMESTLNAGWETIKGLNPWYRQVSGWKQIFIDGCVQGLVGAAKGAHNAYLRHGASVTADQIFNGALQGSIAGVASVISGEVIRFGGLAAVSRLSGVATRKIPSNYFGEVIAVLIQSPNRGVVRAWETLIDFPALRKVPANLEDVSKYVARNPGSEAAISQGLRGVSQYTDDFMAGLRNATEDLSYLGGRSALPDEIADAVTKIKGHRNSIGNSSSGNYGYLEGNVGSTQFGGNDLVRSGAPDNIPEVFEAINVGPNGGWLRTTDSEYKMLNRFANDFGATRGSIYPNESGVLKIVSERAYCPSCQGVIQQFNQMFPNVQLILVDGVRA